MMKRVGTWSLLVSIFLLVGHWQAFAWDFSVKMESEWRYRYISRTGPGDLFGDAVKAQKISGNGTSIGFAGPQMLQVRLEGYSSKGSDASYAEQRWSLYPVFKLNPAVRFEAELGMQGNVNATYQAITSSGLSKQTGPFVANWTYIRTAGTNNWADNPHYNGWIMMGSRDIFGGVAMAVPVIRAAWGTLNLPWGTLTLGRRPVGFALGWVLPRDGVYSTSVSLIVPSGPLTFVFSQYLNESGEYTDPNDDRANYYQPDFYLFPNNHSAFQIASAVDRNETINWNQAAAVIYRAGCLDLGAMGRVIRYGNVHAYPHQRGTYRDDMTGAFFGNIFLTGLTKGGGANAALPIYGDLSFFLGTAYFKYTNGVFFANGEYDCQFIEVRRNGGRPASGNPQAWALEFGGFAGPSKLSLAHFYRSGHDRRYGYYDLTQVQGGNTSGLYANDKFDHFLAVWGSGEQPIRPYAFLMGLYGAGNNSFDTVGRCTFEDFSAVAGRLDYAVAANLNVFGAVISARRASNTGTPLGFYNGVTTSKGYLPFVTTQTANVPDNDLGTEVNAGFNWKLLEGVTFNTLFAYWKPGKWFNFAYKDMTSVTSPETYGAGSVNPGRNIDALIAFQGNVLMEF